MTSPRGYRETELEVRGLRLSARVWGQGEPTIALHGWLDNAATFDRLAPLLTDHLSLIALDLPGHGRSDHKQGRYWYAEALELVWMVADSLGLERINLLGHSMGAGLATLAAGTFPERTSRLIALEGFAPVADTASRAPQVLRRGIKALWPSHPRLYSSKRMMKDRFLARGISEEGACCLVERVARYREGGVFFGHDPNLKLPSLARYTEAQVTAFLTEISCPTLVVMAHDGLRYPEGVLERRLESVRPPPVVKAVDGGHHVHLDHPDRVASPIVDFLGAYGPRPLQVENDISGSGAGDLPKKTQV
jgi:pimeloyl-ACP methyl ester carboxylesterase